MADHQMRYLDVFKIGGDIVDSPEHLDAFLTLLSKRDLGGILIHGGGKIATRLAEQLGVEQTMVNGRRVTNAATLEIAVMTYAGLINKSIVAQLASKNCEAVGVCGADLNLVLAQKRQVNEVDFGFVGDVVRVNAPAIHSVLDTGRRLVVAPISHDGKGQLLNTNADSMASAIATGLCEPNLCVRLYFCMTISGVMENIDDPNSLIPRLNLQHYAELRNQGAITKGMIAKLDEGFKALRGGVSLVTVCHYDFVGDESGGRRATTLVLESPMEDMQ